MVAHVKAGQQMWISKEVSDDLICSHIDDQAFEEVPWPHDKLEMYFEDPLLPTFLLQKSSRKQQLAEFQKWARSTADIRIGGGYSEDGSTPLVSIIAVTSNDDIASSCLSFEDMDAFAAGKEVDEFDRADKRDNEDLTKQEEDAMRQMGLLAYKVLLFASSDGFAPRVTTEVPTKKQGGKPGFKGRPKTKRFIVEYLPRQQAAKKRENAREAALAHNFRGRHGHWRVYRSDRYVNFRGRREYMHPIPGPDGKIPPRKFRVIKPKEVADA